MTDYIELEFDYARDNGWLTTFEQCAKDYDWPVEILMGIASRETNMENIIGDSGHGYGCMQVDLGTDAEFCHSGAWKDPHASIERGVQILDSKRTQIARGVGKTLLIGGARFVGKPYSSQNELNKIAVAAYNCGLWAYYAFSNGKPVDAYDTHHDYSNDVMERAAEFAKLIAVDGIPLEASPAPVKPDKADIAAWDKAVARRVPDVQTVEGIQRALRGLGFAIPLDGVYGPETGSAVAQFQRQAGVPVDGAVGPETRAALQREWAKIA